jgi:hypothetical protein
VYWLSIVNSIELYSYLNASIGLKSAALLAG